MVLSNAQRQARYRSRLKELAAIARISEDKAETLLNLRRHQEDWARQVRRLMVGETRIYSSDVDVSPDEVTRLLKQIADTVSLLAKHDPEGVTAPEGPEAEQLDQRFSRLDGVLESAAVGQRLVMGSTMFEACVSGGRVSMDIHPRGDNPLYQGLWPVVVRTDLPEWEFRIDHMAIEG